jgi:hypothetical protein
MRRWHRWLSIVFGVLAIFIITTGLMSHAASLVADAQSAPAPAPPPGFVCPETMTCRPKPAPDGARAWVGYLHHLHSGEEFGPAGTAIAILTGLALLFFAISGLVMYIQMFRARARPGKAPRGGKWFWR